MSLVATGEKVDRFEVYVSEPREFRFLSWSTQDRHELLRDCEVSWSSAVKTMGKIRGRSKFRVF